MLRRSHPRSAANRAYYACFSACHALLSHLRPEVDWPGRGRFKHGQLPGELRWTLLRRLPGLGTYRVDIYRDLLETAYTQRRLADYSPQTTISDGAVADAVDAAGSLVRLAKGVLK